MKIEVSMELSKKAISPIMAGVITVGSIGIGFGGGVWYQKQQVVNNFRERVGNNLEMRQNGNGNGNFKNSQTGAGIGDRQGMMGRGGVISGEITAKDDQSITIKMSDGSSRIILVDGDTKYSESTESSMDRLNVGTKVAVFGDTTNTTTTADSIEINPEFRGQQ